MYQRILFILLLAFFGYIIFYVIKGGLDIGGKKYKCSNCGHVFKPNFNPFLTLGWLYHGLFRIPIFTKCPKCKKRSMMGEVSEEDNKK